MKKIHLLLLLIVNSGIALYGGDDKTVVFYKPDYKKSYNYDIRQSVVQELSEMNLVSQVTVSAEASLKPKKNAEEVSFEGKYSNVKTSVSGMAMANISDTTITIQKTNDLNDLLTISARGEKIEYLRNSTPKLDKEDYSADKIGNAVFYGSSPLFIEFPDKQIQIGDNWNVELTGLAGNLAGNVDLSDQKTKITYTFVGIKDTLGKKCKVIHCKSTDFSLNREVNQMGVEFKMEGEGIVKGKYYYDDKDGMPVLGSMTIDADVRVAAKGQESAISAMNITLSVYFIKKERKK